jgi:4-carboxymuconolactone decarboxylase
MLNFSAFMKSPFKENSFNAIFDQLINIELSDRTSVSALDRVLIQLGVAAGVDASGDFLETLWANIFNENLLTVEQSEDLVIHLASYIGFLKAKNHMSKLEKFLRDIGKLDGFPVPDSGSAKMSFAQRSDFGMKQYGILDAPRVPEQLKFYSVISEEYYRALMGVFGATFARPSLSVRQREIVTVAVLCALGHCAKQLLFHARVALEQGVEKNVLVEILITTQLFAGSPVANNAAATIRELFV